MRGECKMMRLDTIIKGERSSAMIDRFMERWEYDAGTFQFWRASSNFVYVFKWNQEKYFLRFSHEEDNSYDQVVAEIDFMRYLKENGYPCVSPIPSINGNFIEEVSTTDGRYFGAVFSEAAGSQLDENLTEAQSEAWGRSLATLHGLAKTYKPTGIKRKGWQDAIAFIEDVLQRHHVEKEALAEFSRVTAWLESLPVSVDTYGLIHYDFQQDNVFYDEKNHSFDVIDFDDAIYSWYGMDIVTALLDLDEEEDAVHIQAFLRGYQSVCPLDGETMNQLPKFRRFANLYSFAKILRSIEEQTTENPPEWYVNLRLRFFEYMDEYRQGFSKPW
jgi:Ser/Thr protein kinase RdoA (MazF antagonist)